MYTNAQSIFGKLNELSAYAADMKPDFILVTETWCNPSIENSDLTVPGYQLEQELRKDRLDTANGIGGGIIVYSKIGTKVLPLEMQNNLHQFVAFKIIMKSEPINVFVVYRPPNHNRENVLELCNLTKALPRNSILLGDINLPRINWSGGPSDALGRLLYNTVVEEDLAQLIWFPTHDKGNTLDLLITNMANDIISVYDDGKLGKSDHCVIMTEISVLDKPGNQTKKRIPNWSKADYTGIRTYLSNIDWDTQLGERTTEEAWEILKDHLKHATEEFVPKSTVKGETEPKWLNREIIRLIRKKKRAWKIYKLYNSPESRDNFRNLVDEVKKKIRNAKRGMEKKLANSKDGNSRKFANYIKSKTKTRTSLGPLKDENGNLITEGREMADKFNKFFSDVFTEEDIEHVPTKENETNEILENVRITEGAIKEKIKNLKENSAAGPDGIGSKLLKATANQIAKPLGQIFRKSLGTGEVPSDWRRARVIPIFKKGPKGDPGNYRPVSLTSIVCRILEAIIKDELMAHLKKNNLLRNSQHGFLKGRSCTTNLIQFMDRTTKILDEGKSADIFYLDFAKAFDKVPHERLLVKLKSKGVGGEMFNWIAAWLKNRTQAVGVNDDESDTSAVKSGVPQGSVLGPPLFDIFIDDLDECAELISLLLKFADDTKGLQEIGGPADRDKLQQTLDNMVEWAATWGMMFNIPKCKIMHVGRNNPCFEYNMSGVKLTVVEEEKDIGVMVQKNMKPGKHCKKSAGIAGAVLRQLTKNFHFRDRFIFKKLYIQYVRPHLEFASPAWSPWQRDDIETLEKVQKKAIGMISGLNGRSYKEKCAEIGLNTLEARREKQDLLEAYKIIHGEKQQEGQEILLMTKGREGATTRNAMDPWNLVVPRARLDIRSNAFPIRVANRWNRLPQAVKMSKNLNIFKNALKSIDTGD